MVWKAITEKEIEYKLKEASDRMSKEQKNFWNAICITPEKWKQTPYGDNSAGFWAVAVLGKIVVWYNDIEDGFNYSRYLNYGIIDEYMSNQDSLELVINQLLNVTRPNGNPHLPINSR